MMTSYYTPFFEMSASIVVASYLCNERFFLDFTEKKINLYDTISNFQNQLGGAVITQL